MPQRYLRETMRKNKNIIMRTILFAIMLGFSGFCFSQDTCVTTINYGNLFFLDNKKVPVLVMNFQNLIPTQISGFTLSHTENEPSVLTATVNFVFYKIV
jgi:hypothetical protein